MLKTLIAQKKLCKYLQHKKTSGIKSTLIVEKEYAAVFPKKISAV